VSRINAPVAGQQLAPSNYVRGSKGHAYDQARAFVADLTEEEFEHVWPLLKGKQIQSRQAMLSALAAAGIR
jgi:hypothetical protein